MTPAFTITADGEDMTALIADRLLSLSINDGDGMDADTLDLQLDNRGRRIVEPATGARLAVALGYRGQALVQMGTWTVNGVGGSGPIETMTIRAEAEDLSGPIRSPRTRAWEETTLSAVVTSIARRAGLTPFVSPRLAGIAIDYEAQTAESDLHFVTRLAKRFDAIAKPASGRLVVARRGEGLGDPIEVSRADAADWRWSLGERGKYASVEARYGRPDVGSEATFVAGSGEPKRELRRVYPNAAEAREAATAELEAAARGERTFGIGLHKFRGDLFGGARLSLIGFGPSIDGAAEAQRVRHQLDASGLVTSFDGARIQ